MNVDSYLQSVMDWFKGFVPEPIPIGRREHFLSCVGALIGIFFTAWISQISLGSSNPWFVAPMGASAVLLFAVPSSPLAQPWSILGGNLVAATVGVTCAKWMGGSEIGAALAVAVATSLMIRLRCLHPPSGAIALTAILGGPDITKLGYSFVFFPVAVNSVAITFMALIFNNTIQRHYPHRAVKHSHPHHTTDPLPSERLRFTRSDLDEALKAHGELLDVSPDDLEAILVDAELRADRRHFGSVQCAQIMSTDVVCVNQSYGLDKAWELLAHHKVKALPVIDDEHELVGIVSLHDFYIPHSPLAEGALPTRSPASRVGDMMTTYVQSVFPEQPIADLVGKFSDGGLHHMPVVDHQNRVVGMVTQSDLIAAMFHMHTVSPTDVPTS